MGAWECGACTRKMAKVGENHVLFEVNVPGHVPQGWFIVSPLYTG
jgi:hypothetical protein